MGNGEKYVSESRLLALVLRHKPEVIGIKLDAHGWANVNDLISGMAKKRPFNRMMLEEIVATDAKGRYSFNSDRTLIRANQGHSIPVDVELQRLTPPDTLYHGTAQRFLPGIMRDGILPMGRLYVHLSCDEQTASAVGKRHGKPAILSVDARAMEHGGYPFFQSKNGVWLVKSVPTKYLARVL